MPRRLRVKRARELIGEIVKDAPPENLEISIDGEAIAGRFAVVEITAIPLVGPRLPLAPEADPSDRSLDVCFVGDTAAERQGFARWLEDPDSTDAVRPLRREQRVMVAGQFRRIRLDSKIWRGNPIRGRPIPGRLLASHRSPSHCTSWSRRNSGRARTHEGARIVLPKSASRAAVDPSSACHRSSAVVAPAQFMP